MDKQMIINDAVDRYHKLEGILREKILEDEQAAFTRGRMLELTLLIYTLDERAILRLVESPLDTESEMVRALKILRVYSN